MSTRTLFSVLAALGLMASVSAQAFVINEIYYDGPGTDAGCFTEILAPAGTDLTGYSLVGVNGSNGEVYRTVFLDGMIVPDDGRLVIAMDSTVVEADYIDSGMDWQNGPDEVEFFDATGGYLDGVCYGQSDFLTCEGGTYGPDVASGMSISRCPDGTDTDDNGADTAETQPTPGAENDCGTTGPTDLTLCEAVALDGDGFPIHFGELVHIVDPLIVLNDHGTYSADYLDCGATDGECCVNLFDFDFTDMLMSGDEVEVTGTIAFYNGKIEISGPDLEIIVLSTGNPLPEPESISTEELVINGDQYESCLIMIDHLYITGGDPWPPEGQNANILVADETGVDVTMRIDKETNIDGSTPPDEPFTCIGIGGQFDSSSPYTDGFQILPRSLEDLYFDPTPVHDASWGQMKNMFR